MPKVKVQESFGFNIPESPFTCASFFIIFTCTDSLLSLDCLLFHLLVHFSSYSTSIYGCMLNTRHFVKHKSRAMYEGHYPALVEFPIQWEISSRKCFMCYQKGRHTVLFECKSGSKSGPMKNT